MRPRVLGAFPVSRCDRNDIVEGSFNVLSIIDVSTTELYILTKLVYMNVRLSKLTSLVYHHGSVYAW